MLEEAPTARAAGGHCRRCCRAQRVAGAVGLVLASGGAALLVRGRQWVAHTHTRLRLLRLLRLLRKVVCGLLGSER